MNWRLDGRGAAGTLYSRALVADLCPDALTPLTATAGAGAELAAAWSEVYGEAGIDTAAGTPAELPPITRFGSYLYLDASLLRLLGELSGADPIGFTRQYLAERADVPRRRDPREPTPDVDKEQLRGWAEAMLSPVEARPTEPARAGARREPASGPAPPAGCSDTELVTRIRRGRRPLRQALRRYVRAELGVALSNDLLATLTEQAGHPVHAGALVTGLDGPSAYCAPLWALSRRASRSTVLTRLFDHGVTVLADQLESDRGGDVGGFRSAVFAVADRYGFLGPAEWELSSPTWDEDVRLLLGVLDVWRRVADDADPGARAAAAAETSRAHIAQVRAMIGEAQAPRFDAALRATRSWLCRRHHQRRAVSQAHHEQRVVARELGRRHVETGLLDNVGQIFMLLDEELDAFAADPATLAEQLRLRSYDHHALARHQPPFTSIGPPPPVVAWPRRRVASASGGTGSPGPTTSPAAAGPADAGAVSAGAVSAGALEPGPVSVGSGPAGSAEPGPAATAPGSRVVLSGTPTGPGTASGPARLPRSPSDTRALRPGQVLVLPTAGPAWLPLLPAAAGVVVDAGGALSAVAVACRELGVPCLVGTGEATARIRSGQHLVVEGGTVTGQR